MKKKSIEKILKWFKSMENEEYKFPKTKKELFKLERLDLCCFCHRVPKEISQVKNIKKLVVNIKGIDGPLPKKIKYFKHLEELNLGLTYITKIHPNLYKLKKLRKLDLAGNFFNDIPKGISALRNLKELDLGLYGGKFPKDMVQLKKLTSLNLNFLDGFTPEQKDWINKLKNNGCIIYADDDLFSRDTQIIASEDKSYDDEDNSEELLSKDEFYKENIEKISKIKYKKKNPIPLIDIDEDEIPF